MQHVGIANVEIFVLGGKTKFKATIPAVLNIPGFQNVQAYAIIRDADDDADGALQSVQYILRARGQPCPPANEAFAVGPPKVGVFIMPGGQDAGMLENVCLRTVAGHVTMPSVEHFMGSIRSLVQFPPPPDPNAPYVPNYRHPNNPHKAKAKAFLSTQQYDYPSVGIAAEGGVWDFDHGSLDALKAFLQQLR